MHNRDGLQGSKETPYYQYNLIMMIMIGLKINLESQKRVFS